ncbi:hypothetical protein P3X46_007808 [Hevea brasiliensis]|uniref:Uncharacterized protein n=1 Tax=Hevea brasiliensis TaxID=3981 RepID=A0ABQ9MUP5_HEVBR|nr:hypothetical protein P3X46_007808 [Hevea brasiliensis]
MNKAVIDFVRLLEEEMQKFNSFIVEKEEDFVIKWKGKKAKDSNDKLMEVEREIVDFHGEMVLLENDSALNYTSVHEYTLQTCEDIKEYDKRSGALVRLPFIQKVMQQPFFTTHVLNKLVNECETILDRLFSRNEPSVSPDATEEIGCFPKELTEIENMKNMYMKLTLSALRVLKEIRSGSSTVNVFSLPPLQSNALEEDWKKVLVVEQAAK